MMHNSDCDEPMMHNENPGEHGVGVGAETPSRPFEGLRAGSCSAERGRGVEAGGARAGDPRYLPS